MTSPHTAFRILALLLIGQLCAPDDSHAQEVVVPEGTTPESLKLEFDGARAELLKPVQSLRSKYEKLLRDLLQSHTDEGNLQGVLAVKSELEAYDAEDTNLVAASVFPELSRLQSIYRENAAKLSRQYSIDEATLANRYQAQLTALQKSLTKQGKIEEALEIEETLNGLVFQLGVENAEREVRPRADKRFEVDFSESRWWHACGLSGKPDGTSVVKTPPDSPPEVGEQILRVTIPEGKMDSSPIEIPLQEVFGNPVNHARLTLWMRYEAAPHPGNFSLDLPGFVSHSRKGGSDGTNHWCAHFLFGKAVAENDPTRSYMGYTYHENIPADQRYGSFVMSRQQVDPTRWNRYQIEVKNNSPGDGQTGGIPEDGVISLTANDAPLATEDGFRFRTIEDLPIVSASLQLSRGQSGPGDTKEEIPVLMGGIVIERLDKE